jgi:spore coat assembly protein
MEDLNIGDIVTRKSYNGDIYFRITDIIRNKDQTLSYSLKGLLYRLHADSDSHDLLKVDANDAYLNTKRSVTSATKHASPKEQMRILPFLSIPKTRSCKILHFDADEDFLQICINHYKKFGIEIIGKLYSEDEQPKVVIDHLERYGPDILVLTGHDSIKKGTNDLFSTRSYYNSIYFIDSVKKARKYQPDFDKLCIFAGACQSYFEAIMSVGANFASSPGRILINALDPSLVSEKIALTKTNNIVTPKEIAAISISGSKGIGGINTRGHLKN